MIRGIEDSINKRIHKKYGKNCNISIPIGILGNFDLKYIIHDESGLAVDGVENLIEAIKKCNKSGLYLAKIIETY